MIKDYRSKAWQSAVLLSILTIIYNLVEGGVSIFFGLGDETLTLFGFGVDSFIETVSAIGILIMIQRIKTEKVSCRSTAEKNALRITGWSFMALSATLVISVIINTIYHHSPKTTITGIIISSISIVGMILLVLAKNRTGKKLESAALLADARCNLVCIYMSVVLLLSSLLYELFSIGYIDQIGTCGIIYYSIKEGAEAFNKVRGINCGCENSSQT